VVLAILATICSAYLLGSLPTGYLLGRMRGIDLRKVGSGNIGATNALRVLGKPIGFFVLFVDALKGWLACAIAPQIAYRWFAAPSAVDYSLPLWLPILGGLAAVLGHNFTCWLRFKGGKGVATSAGVALGILPYPLLTVLVVFLVVLLITRIVSLSSLLAAVILVPATWYWHRQPILLAFSIALAALAVHRHRANIQRLLAGTEPRLGQRPPPPTSAAPS
jgi:glycerol-3-phosphate acyltransferase PlsY